jgi:hypothetical protein
MVLMQMEYHTDHNIIMVLATCVLIQDVLLVEAGVGGGSLGGRGDTGRPLPPPSFTMGLSFIFLLKR